MPLSPPAGRRLIHERRIACNGYRRDDGLWDIEGHIVDTKTYGFDNQDRGRIEPGMPIHEMWLRITIDDRLVIHEAEAATEAGPHSLCPAITPRFAELKGLKIGPGWRGEVMRRVGGKKGCTHIVELLLGPMATTAFQTMAGQRERSDRASGTRPFFLDTCHALATDSPVVRKHWPEFYTGE